MKTYKGSRLADGTLHVVAQGDGGPGTEWPLLLRLDLANHSPSGFECGYGGSGPAQLALAILADYLGDGPRALGLYQDYKWRVIADLPSKEDWTLTGEMIDRGIEEILKRRTTDATR